MKIADGRTLRSAPCKERERDRESISILMISLDRPEPSSILLLPGGDPSR